MPTRWLTKEGYPTDEALEKIQNWEIGPGDVDCKDLLDFVEELWYYPNYFNENNGVYEVSTGGWSGNEEIIGALYENFMFSISCILGQRRGGHYVFVLPSVRNKVEITFNIRRTDDG